MCYNTVQRDLDLMSLPEGITLIHYIDGNMLIGPNEQTNNSCFFVVV